MSVVRYSRLHTKGEGRMSTLSLERLDSIIRTAVVQWCSQVTPGYALLLHDFLHAVVASESVCDATGWRLAHRVVRSVGRLAGTILLSLKSHSFGEYVFDF